MSKLERLKEHFHPKVPTIKIEDSIDEDYVFVDTRSPKEFVIDHLPEAVNIPIFDNKERHEIGLLYKSNQTEAYQLGYEIYNKHVEEYREKFSRFKDKKVIIYCWRGGARSQSITSLAIKAGIHATQLKGGYKSYREYVRKKINNHKPNFKIIILSGLACCGKTELLQKLPSIDLEGLAQHRGSAFGHIALTPNSQKKFESLLLQKLKELQKEKIVFAEHESRRIGNLIIPLSIWKTMQNAQYIKIKKTTKGRVNQFVKDYFTHGADKEIKEAIIRLKQHLGKKLMNHCLEKLEEKDYHEVCRSLLVNYYDDKYRYAMKDIKFLAEVNNNNTEECVKELIEIKGNHNYN